MCFPKQQQADLVDLRDHYLLCSCSTTAYQQWDLNLAPSKKLLVIEGGAQGREKHW